MSKLSRCLRRSLPDSASRRHLRTACTSQIYFLRLRLARPAVDDACPKQKIVLVVVDSVLGQSQIIVGLNDADGEAGVDRQVDATADAEGETRASIGGSCDLPAGVRTAQKRLGKGL